MTKGLRKFLVNYSLILRKLKPAQAISLGYAIYILIIFLPLCLPFMWKVPQIDWLDHLFMASSAVSTTGLVTINTPEVYNFWGQLCLLFGMQIGGLGYMTLASFLILASRRKISNRRLAIGRSIFAMPDQFEPLEFIRRAVIFTFTIEIIGATALFFLFSNAGVEAPLWPAIFHSISAFCTAGFSTFPNSLESFRGDGGVNLVISSLSIFGAIGFIVIGDLWMTFSSVKHKITLTSKIILVATFGGLFLGTTALFFDSSLVDLPIAVRFYAAFFQSMSAMTTVGFNSHPIALLSHASIVVALVLMLLGASPSGTGGGLKSTTWSAGVAAAWSSVRGRKHITFFGHVVPPYRIQAAFAAFTIYLLVFALGCFILLLADKHTFEDVVFEVASALGTVGLSRGITGDLTDTGKSMVIILMFMGRVGVISLGLAALARKQKDDTDTKKADFVI